MDYIEKIEEMVRVVYMTLGPGYTESVYDKAVQIELRHSGMRFESQKVVEVKYEGQFCGYTFLDLLVSHEDLSGVDDLIIEFKATSSDLGYAEEEQLKSYMNNLNVKKGLLVNFKQSGKTKESYGVEIKRVFL